MWMVWKQEENCWVYVLWQGGRKREKQMVLERLFIRGVKLPAARMKHFAKNEFNPLIASFIFMCFLRFSARFTEGIMQIRRWCKNMCRIARFWCTLMGLAAMCQFFVLKYSCMCIFHMLLYKVAYIVFSWYQTHDLGVNYFIIRQSNPSVNFKIRYKKNTCFALFYL